MRNTTGDRGGSGRAYRPDVRHHHWVVQLALTAEALVVHLTTSERWFSWSGDLRVPRRHIGWATVLPRRAAAEYGYLAPRMNIGGRLIGQGRSGWRRKELVVTYGPGPVLVIGLTGERFDKLILTVSSPQAVLDQLQVPQRPQSVPVIEREVDGRIDPWAPPIDGGAERT